MRALDEFIGREAESRRVRSLMRSSRLLTLVGPGGVGKTRLAMDHASRARGGGVRLVGLDACEKDDLPQVVAAALGVTERATEPVLETLVAALGDARVLLILDNCEHLADACARLVEALLLRCPKLRILATSREALRVPGEVILRVGGLSLPTAEDRDPAAILRSDAARLFVERARACLPGFELTPVNAALVAEISRQLDGLPLAIELAARRVGQLPLGDVLSGVDGRLTLLSEGSRTAPGRHRELRATIEWSHQLLEPDEQVVFRRISVLPGGFDLAGAVAVCTGFGVEAVDVLPLICALEAKSLLDQVVEEGEETTARFRQLNSIRAYGFERLVESGEVAETRRRALTWLSGLVAPLAERIFPDDVVQALCPERENLVAALEPSAQTGDPADACHYVLIAVGLAKVWYWQGQLSACRSLLGRAWAQAGEGEFRSLAMVEAARAACRQGDHAEGLELAEAAVKIERGRSKPAALAGALEARAFALAGRSRFAEGVAGYQECIEILTSLGSTVDAALCRHNLAWALAAIGEVSVAAGEMAKCLPVLLAKGAPRQQIAALHTHGSIQLAGGDPFAAGETFAEALRKAPLSDGLHLAYPVEGLAIVAAKQGKARRALSLASACAQLRRRIDTPAEPAWQRKVDEARVAARNRLDGAEVTAATTAGARLRGENLRTYALEDKDLPSEVALEPLTERESQVAALVAEGLTNREIAARLYLSPATIATHLTSIRNRLGLRSRTQIALWLVERSSAPPFS